MESNMLKQLNSKLFIGVLTLLFLPAGQAVASPSAKLYISSDHDEFSISFANHDKDFYQGIELPHGVYRIEVEFPNGTINKERIYLAPGEQRDQVILQSSRRNRYNSGLSHGSSKKSRGNILADLLDFMALDQIREKRAETHKTYLASYATNLNKLTTIDGKTLKNFSLDESTTQKHPELIGLILNADISTYMQERHLNKLSSMPDEDAARLKDKLLLSRLSSWTNIWQTGINADLALEDAEHALNISPRSAYAFYQRGIAYEIAGRQEKALDDYETAIQLDSNLAQVYNSIAWLLATTEQEFLRNGKQAVTHAKKAVQLWPNSNFLNTLAAAYAQTQEWEMAISLAKKAIEPPKGENGMVLLQEYQLHLQVFHEHKPWREKTIMPFPDNLFIEKIILKELKAEARLKREKQKDPQIVKKQYATFLYKVTPAM